MQLPLAVLLKDVDEIVEKCSSAVSFWFGNIPKTDSQILVTWSFGSLNLASTRISTLSGRDGDGSGINAPSELISKAGEFDSIAVVNPIVLASCERKSNFVLMF